MAFKIVSLIKLQYKSIDLLASSFPGIGKSIPSGSEFVSNIAIIGIPSFIESLIASGFEGDLVISVSAISELKKGVEEYLRSYHKQEGSDGFNIVAYTVTWTCYEGDGVTIAKGAKEGIRQCELVGLFANDAT